MDQPKRLPPLCPLACAAIRPFVVSFYATKLEPYWTLALSELARPVRYRSSGRQNWRTGERGPMGTRIEVVRKSCIHNADSALLPVASECQLRCSSQPCLKRHCGIDSPFSCARELEHQECLPFKRLRLFRRLVYALPIMAA